MELLVTRNEKTLICYNNAGRKRSNRKKERAVNPGLVRRKEVKNQRTHPSEPVRPLQNQMRIYWVQCLTILIDLVNISSSSRTFGQIVKQGCIMARTRGYGTSHKIIWLFCFRYRRSRAFFPKSHIFSFVSSRTRTFVVTISEFSLGCTEGTWASMFVFSYIFLASSEGTWAGWSIIYLLKDCKVLLNLASTWSSLCRWGLPWISCLRA